MDDRQPPNTLLSPGEDMSPTEQEVIDEYVRLADNMKKVRFFGFGEGGRRLLPPLGGNPTTILVLLTLLPGGIKNS